MERNARTWTVVVMAGLAFAALLGAASEPALAHDDRRATEVHEEHCAALYPPGRRVPRGVVLYFHGGGWLGDSEGPGSCDAPRLYRRTESWNRFRARGNDFAVVSVGYTGTISGTVEEEGLQSFQDAERWYDFIDSNTDLPICVAGGSAGGHLALMLATTRRVDCVLAAGAPVDLTDPLNDVVVPLGIDAPLADLVVDAYGDETTRRRFSPIHRLPWVDPRTPVVAAQAECDPFVDADRLADMDRVASVRPRILAFHSFETHILDEGDQPFMHAPAGPMPCSGVDAEDLPDYQADVSEALDMAVESGGAAATRRLRLR